MTARAKASSKLHVFETFDLADQISSGLLPVNNATRLELNTRYVAIPIAYVYTVFFRAVKDRNQMTGMLVLVVQTGPLPSAEWQARGLPAPVLHRAWIALRSCARPDSAGRQAEREWI